MALAEVAVPLTQSSRDGGSACRYASLGRPEAMDLDAVISGTISVCHRDVSMLLESEIFIILCVIMVASYFGMSCRSLSGSMYVFVMVNLLL